MNTNENTSKVQVPATDEVVIENPFEAMATAFAKKDSGPSGHYLKSLTADELSTLQAFAKWMETTGFSTPASRASYKSYVAACMVAFRSGKSRDDLTSSQKSSMKKFAEFLASR